MFFAETISIYTWRGHYWGFVRDERLFDAHGKCVGWLEEGEVWDRDGRYLGRLVEGGYILRSRFNTPAFKRVPVSWCLAQTPPLFRPPDRYERIEKIGYVDPLETL